MFTEKSWLILQIVLGVGTMIGSWFLNKSSKKDVKYTFSIILGLLVFIATSIIEIRIDYNEKLIAFQVDPDAFDLAKLNTDANNNIKTTDNSLFKDIFKFKKNKFVETLENTSKGKIRIEKEEISLFSPAIFRLNKDNVTILATSFVTPDEWWENEWGKNYLQENYNRINKDNWIIKRIFLYKTPEELKIIKPLMENQKKGKVEVYFCNADNIKEYSLKSDLIVVGDELTGELFLDSDRKISYIEFDCSKEEVEKKKVKFRTILDYSTKF